MKLEETGRQQYDRAQEDKIRGGEINLTGPFPEVTFRIAQLKPSIFTTRVSIHSLVWKYPRYKTHVIIRLG